MTSAHPFPGVRTGAYPGDEAVAGWAAASPYRFLAFPLGVWGWGGRASFLRSLGWGLAVFYRHRGGDIVTRAAGAADARDAVACCRSEGLPPGTICFLDLHDVEAPGWVEYYRGWVGTVRDAGVIKPGACCVAADAAMLLAAGRRERHVPALWVVGSTPVVDAEIVEFPVRVMGEAHARVGLHVRHCAARTSDPSHPIAASVSEVRQLIDSCLGAFGSAQFPRGIANVEMDVTAHDGATTVRLRITGSAGTRR